ncbi:MAG: hypothetical protein KBD37_06490 [Burkholderiales bacterium]|nr:hypothetical protein [Burkholderiales bacterium]
MAKNNLLKKYEIAMDDGLELDEDFSFPGEYPETEAFSNMMESLIEASNHQTSMAIELAKLVIEKHPDQKISEDKIFSIFKKASKVVAESFPLKSLLEQCN